MVKYTAHQHTKKYRHRIKTRRVKYNLLQSAGNNQLKVALFFVGRIKGFEHTKQNLLNIKNSFNPVTFISLNESSMTSEIDNFCNLFDIKNINEQVSLQKVSIPTTKRYKYIMADHPQNIYSMFYNQKIAMKMIENYQNIHKIKFDCVIYYRADIISNTNLKINNIKPNTIYIPDGNDFGGYNDRVAYGNFESMKKYSTTIDLIEKTSTINHPETTLKMNLNELKLNIVRFLYPTELHPSRK